MKWWHEWKRKRNCFHHDMGGNPANTYPAVSWIRQQLIETGRRKMFWCKDCNRHWFS